MAEKIPTILVVEDEAMLALTMEIALQDAGYEVVTAMNAGTAIDALEADAERFAAVVTDIRMPGKGDGWDVGRRARDLRKEMPVLYVTGDSETSWRANGVPDSALLIKPFTLEAIVQQIEEQIQTRRGY